jgi:hypothetical protein
MWEQGGYDNAGGFMNQSQADGGATPGGSAKKMRAQNLVPVNIRNILDCGKTCRNMIFKTLSNICLLLLL